MVYQLADLHGEGKEVLLVTSGAIGLGVRRLGYSRRPKTIPEKQAAAAVGQGILIHTYEKFFAEYNIPVGQVLLTREVFCRPQAVLKCPQHHVYPAANGRITCDQ